MTWNDITGREERQEERLEKRIERTIRPQDVRKADKWLKRDAEWAKKAGSAKPWLKPGEVRMLFRVNGCAVVPDRSGPTGNGEPGYDAGWLERELPEVAGKLKAQFGLTDPQAVFLAVARIWRLRFPVLKARFPGAEAGVYVNGVILGVSGGRIPYLKIPDRVDPGGAPGWAEEPEPVPVPQWATRVFSGRYGKIMFSKREYLEKILYLPVLVVRQDGLSVSFETECRRVGRVIEKCHDGPEAPEGMEVISDQGEDGAIWSGYEKSDVGNLVMDSGWERRLLSGRERAPLFKQEYKTGEKVLRLDRFFRNMPKRLLLPGGGSVAWNSEKLMFYGPLGDPDIGILPPPEIPDGIRKILDHTAGVMKGVFEERLSQHPEGERWRTRKAYRKSRGWLTYLTDGDFPFLTHL